MCDCVGNSNPLEKGTISYLPNPFARAGYDTRSIFKRSLTGLNSEFSFSQTSCLTKAEEPSLSYYLPIAGGRIIGFIPFPRVLVLCEMQSVSSRFELKSPCPIPMTITITPRAPPQKAQYSEIFITAINTKCAARSQTCRLYLLCK